MLPVPGATTELPVTPSLRTQPTFPLISTFVACAALDHPGLNKTLDRFADTALKAGLDVELHNHATGRHGFDVLDSGPRSSEIIARSIEFLKSRLVS